MKIYICLGSIPRKCDFPNNTAWLEQNEVNASNQETIESNHTKYNTQYYKKSCARPWHLCSSGIVLAQGVFFWLLSLPRSVLKPWLQNGRMCWPSSQSILWTWFEQHFNQKPRNESYRTVSFRHMAWWVNICSTFQEAIVHSSGWSIRKINFAVLK